MNGGFNPTNEQLAILRHQPGRDARILAGPGTGKSATVVALVESLLSQNEDLRIRLLTFTRAATGELAKKVAEHPAAALLRPSTVHSFAISVLVRNPGAGEFPEPLRLSDDWEFDNIVLPTLRSRTRVRIKRLEKLFRELAANWERLEAVENPEVPEDERRRFLGVWREHREVFGYTLLAELPNALREALIRHPDLEGLDLDLLIVDEYQDLNACDLELLLRLRQRGIFIIGCGDDNQSIYSFRYASPAGIRRFPDDYPQCSDYPLSITHRCGRHILDWAKFVIECSVDANRAATQLTPAPNSPDGEVALLRFASEAAEARGVTSLVRGLITEGVALENVLILLRSDHQGRFSRPIQEALGAAGIAYADLSAIRKLFAEPENRKLIALLRLLVHEHDSLAWATLLKLERGIGDAFVSSVYEVARDRRIQFGEALMLATNGTVVAEPPRSAQLAAALVERVTDQLRGLEVPDGTPEEQWGAWILSTATARAWPQPCDKLQDLLTKVDALAEPSSLGRYIGQIFPLAKDIAQTETQGVRIMTMTSSKGLTVDATIVVGVEEGLVPHPRQELEEERRLLYVAMTRSKRFLFLTWAGRRQGPTARAGRGPRMRQNHSTFLNGGPVQSQDGQAFIRDRWT